ncbi:hypothetical protein FIU87_13195 [Bacillus sp. THAF10]|uniref:hypothetical protein n=1 Tax=Bacillus sp. THAF10 TaxID=2587848 RepID=UPI0012690782|nr:hypothetical protein [Bacillus sp. THAF10]QFT89610.1 hypothetical protein FIU87_13195 [Bacillus sp. THAF10]
MKKHSELLLWIMVFMSILTLPFLGWKQIKRFLPSTLFISIFIAIEGLFAKKYNWWAVYKKIPPYFISNFAFIIGPFFAGSLWILRLTYGKFHQYILLNAVIDAIFVYPLVSFIEYMGIAAMKKMKRYQFYMTFMAKSILMYVFQWGWEKVKNRRGLEDTAGEYEI